MNLHPKEKKQKELLAMERKVTELWKAKREAPVIKLDKPIRCGWKKFFVLRDDVAKRDDAHVFRHILDKINQVVVSKKKDFRCKQGKKLVDIPHQLAVIPQEKWDLPEHYKKYFRLCEGCKHGGYYLFGDTPMLIHGSHKPSYHFDGAHLYFTTKIKPHFLTHVRTTNGDVESELQKIKTKLEQGGWAKLTRLHGGRYWGHGKDWDKSRGKGREKQELIQEIKSQLNEDV